MINKDILDSGFSLYEELSLINTIRVVGHADATAEAEAEN